MSYTQEDKEAFARKDRMIVAQSTLERAMEFHSMQKTIASLDEIKATAKSLFDYVFCLADNKPILTGKSNGSVTSCGHSSVDVGDIPAPTLAQMEWLDKIQDKYGFSKEQIWEKCKKYPSNKDEAIEIMKQLKGN